MRIKEAQRSLSELYKDCSEFLDETLKRNNMLRHSKDALQDSIRNRHIDARDIVKDAHEIGLIDADKLYADGAWMGDTIHNIEVTDLKAPFYKAVVQTPSEGRALRASVPHHVNNPHLPYVIKNYDAHLNGVVSYIRNLARKTDAQSLVENTINYE